MFFAPGKTKKFLNILKNLKTKFFKKQIFF